METGNQMKIEIDHERHGVATIFESIEEATTIIRDIWPDDPAIEFRIRGEDVIDDRNDIVGHVVI